MVSWMADDEFVVHRRHGVGIFLRLRQQKPNWTVSIRSKAWQFVLGRM
jgi:transcription-repair coupling factor (superfamily II helicase)